MEVVPSRRAVIESIRFTVRSSSGPLVALSMLSAVRRRLADNRKSCALFDTSRFTRNLEAAYRKMHERSRSGLSPDDLVVPGVN